MIPLLGATIVDVTIVLAAALTVNTILRRRSAALRHAMLAAAMIAALAIPLLEQLVPAFLVELPWTQSPVTESTMEWSSSAPAQAASIDTTAATTSPVDWTAVAISVWAIGVVIVFAGLLTGLARLVAVTRRCTPIDAGPWHDLASDIARREGLTRRVRLLQSTEPSLLVTWGLLRPRILLPAGAETWSAERRGVVIAHELAHIRRHDWTWQLAAETLRAVHWINPLAWIACRRLRQESEYACDDAVLEAGVEATEYASHLLEVARHAIGHGAWASAPAVANPSTLERRIAAMLTNQRNRRPVTRGAGVLTAGVALLVALPVAAVGVAPDADAVPSSRVIRGDVALASPADRDVSPRPLAAAPPVARAAAPPPAPPAQQRPAAFLGTVIDPSGGVLPGVALTLTDVELGIRFSAVSDRTGSFLFRDLQPGRYELVARLAGFATVTSVFRFDAGTQTERRLTLPLGSLQETLTMVCAPGAAVLPTADRRAFAFSGRVAPAAASLFTRPAPTTPGLAAQDAATAPRPVRVGGQIRAPRQLKKVNPVCPRTVLPSDDTVVVLVGTIGVDGYMYEVQPAEPKPAAAIPPSEFVESALEAVRQWQYSPTLLNNVAVPVQVTVTILYRRG